MPLRSVTELEILYAALFYPHLAQSAAFYLRDPDYSHRNRLGDNEPLRDKVCTHAGCGLR